MSAVENAPEHDRRVAGRDPEPPLDGAEPVAIPSVRGLAGGLLGAIARPRPLAREAVQVGRDMVSILRGTDEIAPPRREGQALRRPGLVGRTPRYRRLAQDYLAASGGADPAGRRATRPTARTGGRSSGARFAVNALTSALAPTNTLLGNPAALKRAFDTGGRSVRARARQHARRPPAQRRDAARRPTATRVHRRHGPRPSRPGAVVYRDDVIELIQYTPTTPSVRQRPLVIVPPPIGRFYFLDLRPGRSFVEYAVEPGPAGVHDQLAQPDARSRPTGTSTPTPSASSPGDRRRRGRSPASPDVNTLGLLRRRHPHDDAAQPPRRRPATTACTAPSFAVTLLDFDSRAPIGAFSGPRLLGRSPGATPAARGVHHRRGRWARCSPGCAPTTWSSTTWSTSG